MLYLFKLPSVKPHKLIGLDIFVVYFYLCKTHKCFCIQFSAALLLLTTMRFNFLAHLTWKVKWAFLITWRPSSVNFYKNLLLWNYLATIILGVFSLKNVSDDLAIKPRWPPWLEIEHRGKMYILVYIFKTKAFRANLTG